MPSVYTIEGARGGKRRKRKKKLSEMTPAQRRFTKIARKCSTETRQNGRSYQACMRRELKK